MAQEPPIPPTAVIDTNIIFSALYRPQSPPGRVIALALEGRFGAYAPDSVRSELERALRGKLAYSDHEWMLTLGALPIEWVERALYAEHLETARGAIADESDAPLVALALAIGCGVVSGDRAFHPLRRPIVPTWTAAELTG